MCPLTLTFLNSSINIPSLFIKKVLLSTPIYFCRTYFSFITSYNLQTVSSGSLSNTNGSDNLVINLSWDAKESLETPKIIAFKSWKFCMLSLKSQASVVQPAVLSLG